MAVTYYKMTRYNDLGQSLAYSTRPPLEFGIRRQPGTGLAAGTLYERLEDATSLTVDTNVARDGGVHVSGYSSYMPWSGMKRCMLGYGGDINVMDGDLDDNAVNIFDNQIADYFFMVRIPKFWCKFIRNTATSYDYYYISPYPLKGYRLHPAFVRAGYPVDNIYVSAVEAYQTGSFIYSSLGTAPTTNIGRDDFRGYTNALNELADTYTTMPGYGWGLIDLHTWSAIQLLYLVEYASNNSQLASGSTARGGLGEGYTHAAALTETGWTFGATAGGPAGGIDMGNGSGEVLTDHAGDYVMTYRGIENLWGNAHTMLDGVNVELTSGHLMINDTYHIMDDIDHTGYYHSACDLPAAGTSDYIQYVYVTEAFNEACQFIPYDCAGADATSYFCDTYVNDDYDPIKILKVGGYYLNTTGAGIFGIDTGMGINTHDANTGTRLQYIPYDFTKYNKY